MTTPEYAGPVEQLLAINRDILLKELELQRTKSQRLAFRAGLMLVPTMFFAIYISTAATWGKFDMKLINVIAIPIDIFLIVGAITYYVNRRSGRIGALKLVGDVELDLTVLRERRRFMAISHTMTISQRRSIYKDDTNRDIELFRRDSRHYRRINNVFQSLVIVGSLFAASMSSLAVEQESFRWATVVATFLVGISAGFTGYFKFKDRGFYLQQTADALEHEWSIYDLGIGQYKRLEPEEALADFVEEAERIKAEQRQREQNLDQPSDGRDSANQQ
ncbi:DUF4231 domain-containing protein [Streptosporangium amethystogenes]|uniref:DUF4231 domain-containing protein n=1 Tax=Streptosporangium amethystogenes TaxID=2002 RepID=UPI0037B4E20F